MVVLVTIYYIWLSFGPFIMFGTVPALAGGSPKDIIPEGAVMVEGTSSPSELEDAMYRDWLVIAIPHLVLQPILQYYYFRVARRYAALHPDNKVYKLQDNPKLIC